MLRCHYSGFASSILKVAYGIKAKDETDPFISIVEAGHEGVVDGLPSGRFLVEFLPFLRHVQPWIPFSRSPKLWAKWQAAGRRMKETPYVFTKAQLVSCSPGLQVSAPDHDCPIRL